MRLNYTTTSLAYLFCFLLVSIKINAATTIDSASMPLDSLINWVEENVQQIVDTEETKHSYDYAYIALRRAREIGNPAKIAKVHESLAYWHYLHIDSEITDSILYHDEQALKYYRLAGDEKKVAKTLTNESDPFMVAHSFEKNDKTITFWETDHKNGGDSLFKLTETAEGHTHVQYIFYMKNSLIMKFIFKLFLNKKYVKLITQNNQHLNDYCKQLVREGRQHPNSIVLKGAASLVSEKVMVV